MICSARSANCSGRPSSFGNGIAAARLACTSGGMPDTIGVAKMPGAMAMTRMPNWANSRAAGSISDATAPLEAAGRRIVGGGEPHRIEGADQVDVDDFCKIIERLRPVAADDAPRRSDA